MLYRSTRANHANEKYISFAGAGLESLYKAADLGLIEIILTPIAPLHGCRGRRHGGLVSLASLCQRHGR